MRKWEIVGFIATALIVLIIPISILKKTNKAETLIIAQKSNFVGSTSCIECHQNEYELWSKSHHAHSMNPPTPEHILGNFDNIEYNDGINTHKFYKKGDKYFVNTIGPKGKPEDFEISYTFGYKPLQQYLIQFEKGRYQCLHIAWDSEKNQWFNMSQMVYNEDIKHNNWLHWTNQAQNWNGMCAECHSTNLKKNYIPEADSFNTTFSEITVSCESCHGPGSGHLEWAAQPEGYRNAANNYGLMVQTRSISNEKYVDLCARCHARRGQVSDFDHSFKDIYDYMVPTLLSEEYHPDGQILDEDYVYGSFKQSKMFHNDIKCNDCHDVHSGERFFEGNALCYQCHTADYYGTKNHHFHKVKGEAGRPLNIKGKTIEVGEGALCVNCHMPGQYYMGIDFRNDHSIRNPRPDLSLKIGTPNACNQCHTDKDAKWATKYFKQWYGEKYRPHYGEVFALARERDPRAEKMLQNLLKDTLHPLIVRATALDLLGNYNSDSSYSLLRKHIDSPKPMLRMSAIRSLHPREPKEFANALLPVLYDPHTTISSHAAFRLSALPKEYIPENYNDIYNKAIAAYKKHNEYSADFSTGRMNLGIIHANQGDFQTAKYNYQKALEIDSAFDAAKFNLALVHNQLGENDEAEKIYRWIIKDNPEYIGVYYSLGLLLAEKKKYAEATENLEIAFERSPENTRILYNLALLYQQLGNISNAEEKFKLLLSKEPENHDYLYAMATFYINSGNVNKAIKPIEKLIKRYPNSQSAQQLSSYLKQIKNR